MSEIIIRSADLSRQYPTGCELSSFLLNYFQHQIGDPDHNPEGSAATASREEFCSILHSLFSNIQGGNRSNSSSSGQQRTSGPARNTTGHIMGALKFDLIQSMMTVECLVDKR